MRIRQEVEVALRTHGPGDEPEEINDIVATLTNKARAEVLAEEAAKQRSVRKEPLLSCAEIALASALNHCPISLVGKPRSNKRVLTLRRLLPQLRQALATELTGDESLHALVQRVEEWVAAWVFKENPNAERREFLEEAGKWTTAGLGAGLGLTLLHPKVRAGLAQAARALGDRLAPYEPFFRHMAEHLKAELRKKDSGESDDTESTASSTNEG